MAITVAKVAELLDTSNVNDYAAPAYTPAADTIQVAFVHMSGSDGSTIGTFDDAEGAWTKKQHNFFDTNRSLYVFWRKVDASPVSITPTFHNTDTGTGCGILILEFNPDTMPSGDPLRQSSFSSGTGTTSLTFTYASAVETGNAYAALIRTDVNPSDATVPTGWTENLDLGYATPTIGLFGCSRAGGETGTSFTATANSGITAYAAAAVEVLNYEPSTDRLLIAKPKQTKLVGSTKRFPAVSGLRRGLSAGQMPLGEAVVVTTKAVRPKAQMRSRLQLLRITPHGLKGQLRTFGGTPIVGVVPSVGQMALEFRGNMIWIK